MKPWARTGTAVVAGAFGCAAAAFAVGLFPGRDKPRRHTINVVARRYAFEPAVIRVERGDEVRLRFASKDVVHGFRLEGYDVDVTIEPLRREVMLRRDGGTPEAVQEVAFVATRAGKFRYRCSKTCGAMHPFMAGELIVGPNHLLHAASAAAVGLLAGGLLWSWSRASREGAR